MSAYLISAWKIHQNEYKQACVWSSGSWDSLWYFHMQDIFFPLKRVVGVESITKHKLHEIEKTVNLYRVNSREKKNICLTPSVRDMPLYRWYHHLQIFIQMFTNFEHDNDYVKLGINIDCSLKDMYIFNW